MNAEVQKQKKEIEEEVGKFSLSSAREETLFIFDGISKITDEMLIDPSRSIDNSSEIFIKQMSEFLKKLFTLYVLIKEEIKEGKKNGLDSGELEGLEIKKGLLRIIFWPMVYEEVGDAVITPSKIIDFSIPDLHIRSGFSIVEKKPVPPSVPLESRREKEIKFG